MNNKKSFQIIAVIFVLALFTSCDEKLPIYQLTKEKSIDSIRDSIFFSSVKCLTFYNNNLYYTDAHNDRIICLNQDLSLNCIIGKKGQGPSELLGITQFAIHDSLIAVLNGGNNRINMFELDGTLRQEYPLTNVAISFDTNYRFCLEKGVKIMGYSSIAATPMTSYNMDTQEQLFWGKTYQFASATQTAIRNGRFMGMSKDQLVTVSDNLPIIEIYNRSSYELIYEYDFSQISIVKKAIREIDNKGNNNPNSYFTVCEEISISDDKLYLLISNYEKRYTVNEIIVFDLEPTIRPVSIIKLTGGLYTSFCVEGDYLYAYNREANAIEKFSMPKY